VRQNANIKFLDFFGIIADFGLYTVIIRELSKDPENESESFNSMFSLRMVLAIGAFILASIFVYLVPEYRGTVIPIGVILSGIAMVVTFFNGTLTALLQRHWDMGFTSMGVVVGKVVQVILYLLLFLGIGAFASRGSISNFSFYLLFATGIIAVLITSWFTYSRSKKYVKLHFSVDFAKWKKIIIETFPYGLAIFLATVYLKIDVIMLSIMKGQYEVGIYGISAKLLEILMIFPQYFLNSLLPLFTLYLVTNRDRERFSLLMNKTFLVMSLMAFPIVAGGIGLSYPLIVAIGDPEYLSTAISYGSDTALRALLLTLPFTFFAQVFQYLLIVQKKHFSLLYINLFAVIINIGLNFIMIPKYGFMGAAWTTIISEIFALTFSFYFFRTDFKYDFPGVKMFSVLLISIFLGWLVKYLYDPTFLFIGNYNIPILIMLYGSLYLGFLFVFKLIDFDEIRSLFKKT